MDGIRKQRKFKLRKISKIEQRELEQKLRDLDFMATDFKSKSKFESETFNNHQKI